MASTHFSRFASRFRAYAPDPWVLFTFASWIPALIFVNSFVVETVWVRGPSMYPYLNTDYDRSMKSDACLSWKWKPTEGLQRGMIVAFWSPNNPEVQAIKRVIALEGDQVHTRAPYPHPVAYVPAGHVWVEGDGRERSLDSNTYGPISKNLITGKITHVVWPLRSFGPVYWDQFKGKTMVKKRQQQER